MCMRHRRPKKLQASIISLCSLLRILGYRTGCQLQSQLWILNQSSEGFLTEIIRISSRMGKRFQVAFQLLL